MNNPSVLIIEDNQKLATIFAETLRTAKFKTEVALDGHTALERLTETIPDIVILDLHLPHVSGKLILQRIRADERLARTRVLIVTADAAMANSLSEEADLTLLKPVSVKQLRDLARRLSPPDTLDEAQ